MDTLEKLDIIEGKLDYLLNLLENKRGVRAKGQPRDQALRNKLQSVIDKLPPGRVPIRVLAGMAELPPSKQSSHAVGRVLDAMGIERYATASDRGFVVAQKTQSRE